MKDSEKNVSECEDDEIKDIEMSSKEVETEEKPMSIDEEKKVTKIQDDKQKFTQCFKKLHSQLQNGCGREFCSNLQCASSFGAEKLDSKAAAMKAISLLQSNAHKLCFGEIPPYSFQKEELLEFKEGFQKGEFNYGKFEKRIRDVFTDIESLGLSFRSTNLISNEFLNLNESKIDYETLQSFYSFILEVQEKKIPESTEERKELQEVSHLVCIPLKNESYQNRTAILDSLTIAQQKIIMRGIFILLENPLLGDAQYHSYYSSLLKTLHSLPLSQKSTCQRWFQEISSEEFLNLVIKAQTFLTIQIYGDLFTDERVKNSVYFLDTLHQVNKISDKIEYREFYNDAINNGVYLTQDFEIWIRNKHLEAGDRKRFTMCDYPWILDPASKSSMLTHESTHEKRQEVGDVYRNFLAGEGSFSPYLIVEVRREYLIEDTLDILIKGDLNLRKPLKVKFVAEPGVDEGGLQKEFFQLIIRQIFDVNYGMFLYNEETRVFWFNTHSFEPNIKFELIGSILGLAIYNSVILDIHFPLIIYKKLLNQPIKFEDLREYSPIHFRSLKALLDYKEDDVEEKFCLTFCVESEVFGEIIKNELLPDGAEQAVTLENKDLYVQAYVDWFFTNSCEYQFKSFKRGFERVYKGEFLNCLTPQELELFVCGSPVLDFNELKKNCVYENGYDTKTKIINDFWEIVDEMTNEQKKKFLFFATGSDRAPINGLGKMSFCIMRHGGDSDRLPCAHTCFNHILLPHYRTKEKLKKLLLLAITNSEGFGLM